MMLELLDELGAGPAEALMIGDSRWDLEMAAGAGTGAVAVASGSHRREELIELAELHPLAILEGVSELPGWLRRRYSST
jgi:phosphoglycolate phosphatase